MAWVAATEKAGGQPTAAEVHEVVVEILIPETPGAAISRPGCLIGTSVKGAQSL
jgi:hypothetical protein